MNEQQIQVTRPGTTADRSALMKRVRQRGTDLELSVRRILTTSGVRYRLNVPDLPGSPDIAHKGRRKAIFVHGCFWHHHSECSRGRIPKRNREFWRAKLEANRSRDCAKVIELEQRGFDVLIVWECELDDPSTIRDRLADFWSGGKPQ